MVMMTALRMKRVTLRKKRRNRKQKRKTLKPKRSFRGRRRGSTRRGWRCAWGKTCETFCEASEGHERGGPSVEVGKGTS